MKLIPMWETLSVCSETTCNIFVTVFAFLSLFVGIDELCYDNKGDLFYEHGLQKWINFEDDQPTIIENSKFLSNELI